MGAIRVQRTSRAFLPLTILLALVWPASVTASAPANSLAERAAAVTPASGSAAMVWQHGRLGGLVANRRSTRGRYGPLLVGTPTGAREIVLLIAAVARSAAAAGPRRWTQSARVGARAPPLLQLA
jgi:hypothetical protein